MRRQTRQRDSIRQVLADTDRPLGPAEILELARKRTPSLGIATVYRTIRTLVSQGWLKTVDLPGATSRYELAEKHHHHHFHCQGCDRVFEVEDCPGSLARITPEGFRLDSHDLTLFGLCKRCHAAEL